MKKPLKTIVILTALLALGTTEIIAQSNVQTPTTQQQGAATMTLSQKQYSLAQIGAFTANGDIRNLNLAIDQALDNGLTVNEIQAAMVQLYAYAGFPRSLNALSALSERLKVRQAQGLKSEQGRAARLLPKNTDLLARGEQTQTELIGQAIDLSALSPDIDRYLKSHLFGDIFANDLLNWQEREIVTVAALSHMQGVENQLRAHIDIGKKNGITDEQIKEIVRLSKQEMSQFPAGEENTAYAKYFVGKSYLNMLSAEQMPIGNVTFEPGTRNNWHIHHATKGGGQILMVTAGRGYYQEWGKPAQELKAGDVVHISAGTKHWHGAAPTEWFQHLAIEVPGENTRNEWLEPVSDADYGKLK
ncbi:carboxymuconolactone decarboxylase family protein [Exercitatus varius]|uniref:carboxymuconolactone decarboxylase family protein n=1 Tax=Exercitatus varius TaxID=67857 RepID=UPI00294AEA53|nr:carboxymuconolactone decarboxylase family protein [Exercitatus varius]MDG2941623.1 carboxymuconolactone decarboxylase family protein [Exercitatus varius]